MDDEALLKLVALDLDKVGIRDPGCFCRTSGDHPGEHFSMGKKGRTCYWNTGQHPVGAGQGVGDDTLMRTHIV